MVLDCMPAGYWKLHVSSWNCGCSMVTYFYLLTKGVHTRIHRGTGGPDTPPPHLKNYKNIGFLICSNTGPDPLKITKLPSQHSMLDHYRHTVGVSLADRWWPAYSGIWILSPLNNNNNKKHCQKWTNSEKTFWICTWRSSYCADV